MLISTDYKDKNKSLYLCDKCGTYINNSKLKRVVLPNRTYHLCFRCYKILWHWINKRKER